MNKGKYLAIDYGDRRVGLAVSDFDKQIAFPREVLSVEKETDLIRRIKEFCEKEEIVKIILGLPIQMDGQVGKRFVKTYQFGDRLKKELAPIPIEYFDERLTTRQSIGRLQEQGIKSKNQKSQRDMVAAQGILEGYLRSL